MSRMVRPLSLASVGGGADGLMIEVHNDPSKALCDGPQALRPDQFTSLMKEVFALRKALVECTNNLKYHTNKLVSVIIDTSLFF